jgi:hypothetical protein
MSVSLSKKKKRKKEKKWMSIFKSCINFQYGKTNNELFQKYFFWGSIHFLEKYFPNIIFISKKIWEKLNIALFVKI